MGLQRTIAAGGSDWAVVGAFVSVLVVGCSDGGSTGGSEADVVGADGRAEADIDRRGDSGKDADGGEAKGPRRVLDVESAREYRDLEMEISQENSGDVVVRRPSFQTEVFELDFRFQSQQIWGSAWEHPSALYLPDEINPAAPEGAFVIVQSETKNPVPDVSEQARYRSNYAGAVAAAMGIPALVVANLPGTVNLREAPEEWSGVASERCYTAGLPAERYTPCLLEILRVTGDLEADPFRHVAYAWMRSVTAGIDAMRVSEQLEWPEDRAPLDWRPERALILADGARAVGARMAAVADSRIDGVFGNADFAKLSELFVAMERQWSADYGWFDDPGAYREWLADEKGREWKETVDPAEWRGLFGDTRFVHSRGTGDDRFPLGSGRLVAEAFPGDAPQVVAPGYGAGIGSAEHLWGWYGYVAHVYLNRPWGRVSADTEASGANIAVRASMEGEAEVEGAVVYWMQQHRERDDHDFRDAVWQTTEMSVDNGEWSADVAPIVENHALGVLVETRVDVPTVLEDPASWTIEPRWSSAVEIFGAE